MDYFMNFVICISWLRFFVYFLVIRNISKLIFTLIAMIGDTLSFMFIISCFLLIMSSIFTTLYQDTNPVKYGGLGITVTTLFDATIGNYDFSGMAGRDISHSILLIFHVFSTNILLMNYLIAILSTTYENMKQSGVFRYKVNLYSYCERYIKAFQDKAYGEIIIHPPPLSVFTALLLPLLISQKVMEKFTYSFSICLYWIENVVFIISFFFLEIAMSPFAYVKTWSNILRNSKGFVHLFCYSFLWAVHGLPIILVIVFMDVYYLMRLYTYTNGCRVG